MFGIKELKTKIPIDSVYCPVNQCKIKVKKMNNRDLKSLDSYLEREKPIGEMQKFDDFFCKSHKIYITPSTFIYEDYKDNLLWYEAEDKRILDKILEFKRVKAQLHHDNSEDAVSWNVFRFLERNNLIEGFLSYIIGKRLKSSEVIYWSYSQKQNGTWPLLAEARKKIGETEQRGSEPDIIITTNKALFFIEAKLISGNETKPSNESNSKEYVTGGNSWFSEVFDSNYETVAIRKKKYELMRFWLLGTWMADQQKKDFCLINLVRDTKERNIESLFGPLIRENERRRFMRITWEQIYEFICGTATASGRDQMIRFFKNKTIGYDGKGNLRPAFSVS